MTRFSYSGCTNLNVNMKKILMVKFEEKSYPSPLSEVTITSKHVNKQEKVNSEVQPPLPPNPPPPDSSPKLMIKKEIEDKSYLSNFDKKPSKVSLPDGLLMEFNKSATSNNCEDVPKKKPMCRRFARGTCTKGSACIFRHEIDLAQLEGIYKFCWDFQNSICSRKNCRHVHATVFEEQHFYRTGYLPPHARAHQKVQALQHPSCQLLSTEELRKPMFTRVLAPSNTDYVSLSNMTVNNIYPQPVNGLFQPLLPRNNISPKRKLNDLDTFSRSPGDLDYSEPLTKKCKMCDLNEIRLEINKNKLEDRMRSIVRLKEDVGNLNKKHNRLWMVLMTLHQNKISNGFDTPNGLHCPIKINGQNGKNIGG